MGTLTKGLKRAPEGAQVLLTCLHSLSSAHTSTWGWEDKGGCLDPPVMGNGPAPSTLIQQVPEWTKCTSREKRKDKVEKPFYSDSEGESGPTESADSGEDLIA